MSLQVGLSTLMYHRCTIQISHASACAYTISLIHHVWRMHTTYHVRRTTTKAYTMSGECQQLYRGVSCAVCCIHGGLHDTLWRIHGASVSISGSYWSVVAHVCRVAHGVTLLSQKSLNLLHLTGFPTMMSTSMMVLECVRAVHMLSV
jgi:hypothetical protein